MKIDDGPMTNFLLFNETRGGRAVACTDGGLLTVTDGQSPNPLNSAKTEEDFE